MTSIRIEPVLAIICATTVMLLSAASQAQDSEARWSFQPPKDEFSADALLDLRSMNEKTAGESGFISRTKDGNDFVLGNGKPIRFWALGTDASRKHQKFPAPDLAVHARFMAKRGINLVRCFCDISTAGNLNDIDTNERDRLWRTVAAMKKEGIYTLFTPIWIGASKLKNNKEVLDDGGNRWGLLFIDKKLQDAFCNWMKQVFTEKNPYTGIPLKDDPALAIFQIQNEDSLLFWTFGAMKGAAKAEIRRQFGEYLKTKYGSLEKAKEAWGSGSDVPKDQDSADSFDKGEAAMFGLWEMTQRREGEGRQKRLNDQYEFTCKTMYDFNKKIVDYVRKELGCKFQINAGNWRTADQVIMLDGERWSYTATDIMGVNRYYTGIHKGPNEGWAICNGDKFTDESVLLRPRYLPVTLKQVEGYPMIITESTWVPPLGYQSEGPFLISAYQSLNGVDAYFWFATGEETWNDWTVNMANGYMPSQGKWICATPMLMGQWPAASLMYRMGYIAKGAPSVHEERSMADLFGRAMPIIAEDEGYDPNRDKGSMAKESNIKDGVNPLAYLVGPVEVKYGGDPTKSKVADLSKYIDADKKTIKSDTGELLWDYGTGLCTLNAPKAQGVTGFLKKAGGTFKLGDIEIKSGNEYATILAVSMDDKPLKSSGKILVQVGTTERSTGWKTSPTKIEGKDGEQIVSFGKAPWQIVNADVTVTVNNPGLAKAVVLDVNGMQAKELQLEAGGGGKVLKFPPDALYVILADAGGAKAAPIPTPKLESAAAAANVPTVADVKPAAPDAKSNGKPDAKPAPAAAAPAAPAADDPESQAKRKLAAAKVYVASDPAKAKEMLREIITKYPDTESGKEARKELAKLN